ncbi:BamA/TamA family outer membrane protein [Trichothermofontia sichuanensis B231]|uniref:BamA/TamA family outer membrane protein n=1 Tax=Trichothermofontia sichuanensis TaxID=3045816 RepID=UPI00224665EA|nr:BamA/TamA family outer membrane protein [Trichothermofontia sichuanensis]UZQ54507.1 BamA/TamA family outer membrane protein [Trichothermofontia sichuanensis B231]
MRLTISAGIRTALSVGTMACTGLVAIAGAGETQILGYPTNYQATNEAIANEGIIVPTVPIVNFEQPTRSGQPKRVPSLPMEGVSQVNNADLALPSSAVTPSAVALPNASDWLVPAPLPVPRVSPIAVPAPPPEPAIPNPAILDSALEANCQQAPAGGVYVCSPVADPASQPPPTTSADFPRPRALSFDFAPGFPVPTVLPGSARASIVQTPTKSTGLAGILRLAHPLSDTSNLALVLEGGEHIFAFDAGFTQLNATHQGLGVNFAAQTSWSPAFRGGDREVDLAGGDTPWVQRLGGGIETYFPVSAKTNAAFGVGYQQVSVRSDAFGSGAVARDEVGNRVTVDADGIDDLMTLNFALVRDNLHQVQFPREGSMLRVGADQGFTIGRESVTFTRLNARYTQYVPVEFFGLRPGPKTLIFDVQAGTILGEVPPYEGFNLGGISSVRGWDGGGISTGTSFVQGAVEYRFPLFDSTLFERAFPIRGALFTEFASDLGTADEVIGQPAKIREKPGEGFGFGLGLQTETAWGLGRLEFALTNEGDASVIVTIGDRF